MAEINWTDKKLSMPYAMENSKGKMLGQLVYDIIIL